MRTKTTSEPLEIPDDFAPLVSAFERDAEVMVEKGWGAGNIVLKVGGKIFAMSIRGDLVAKLPKKRVDALVDDDAGVRFDPRRDGRVMSEWIVVSADSVDWVALAREALAYVRAGGAPVKAARVRKPAAKAAEPIPTQVPPTTLTAPPTTLPTTPPAKTAKPSKAATPTKPAHQPPARAPAFES